jgi:hypothetical protein
MKLLLLLFVVVLDMMEQCAVIFCARFFLNTKTLTRHELVAAAAAGDAGIILLHDCVSSFSRRAEHPSLNFAS